MTQQTPTSKSKFTPSIYKTYLNEDACLLYRPSDWTIEEVAEAVTILENDKRYLVLQSEGFHWLRSGIVKEDPESDGEGFCFDFDHLPVEGPDQERSSEHGFQADIHVVYPIDPRIKIADVEGFTQHYLNEAGTGWLFRRTISGQHYDVELQLRGIIQGWFAPHIDRYLEKRLSATNAITIASSTTAHKLIISIRDNAIINAMRIARAKHLGYWLEGIPYNEGGRIYTAVKSAINTAISAAKGDKVALAGIRTILRPELNTLITPTPPKTRWDIESEDE